MDKKEIKMPKILGIIGSIAGAFIFSLVLGIWQGDLPGFAKLLKYISDALPMCATTGFISSLFIILLHDSGKSLSYRKAFFCAFLSLAAAVGFCLLPYFVLYERNATGINLHTADDLILLLAYVAFACGTGQYLFYRYAFLRTA